MLWIYGSGRWIHALQRVSAKNRHDRLYKALLKDSENDAHKSYSYDRPTRVLVYTCNIHVYKPIAYAVCIKGIVINKFVGGLDLGRIIIITVFRELTGPNSPN